MRKRSAATFAANTAAIKERSETELIEFEVQQKKIESLTSQNAALEKQVTVSIFLIIAQESILVKPLTR